MQDKLFKDTPFSSKQKAGDRLNTIITDILHLDWIFSTPLEKGLLLIIILFAMYCVFTYVRGLF